MARQTQLERQKARDARQIRQHYVHWGVKAVVSLVAAAIFGSLWLAWRIITGH